MTDYLPLIARAVEGLEPNTGEARRALYERARAALVAQLRSADPALPEAEITKERLALEDAIRKVEADAARKLRAEQREMRPAFSPPRDRTVSPPPTRPFSPQQAGKSADAAKPDGPALTARERLLSARTSSSLRDSGRTFHDVGTEGHDLGAATAKVAPLARESYGRGAPTEEALEPPSRDFEPRYGGEEMDSAPEEGAHSFGRKSTRDFERDKLPPQTSAWHPSDGAIAGEDHYRTPPRSMGGGLYALVAIAVGVIILAGIGATAAWQWNNISALYQRYAHFGAKPSQQTTTTPAPTTPTAQPKFPGRVPQEQSAGQGAAATPQAGQGAPAVAQRVVLYEEDPNDPQGKRSVGSAIWHTETVSPGPGLAPELAIRADVEIPERRMAVTWTLRRNTDQALPASHTIEIIFKLPPDFAGGGIANVPGILMKQSEQARGTPLAGLAVKVTNGFFLVGLSAVEADVQRNIQLLKERPWFDIPVVYTSGGRAILAMEKGPPGDQAFAEAFAAWDKQK
jgi:hypothetical protein